MNNIVPIKGTRQAPKAARSKMDTLIFSAAEVNQWKLPPFQRPLRVNDKVKALSEELKHNGGIITGVITLGKIDGKSDVWLVDGQHRTEAFKISELTECIADVRMCEFANMGEMAEEFVNLNTALVKMRPDDVLRGLEGTSKMMQLIRAECPYVGYDQIRRNPTSAVIGMSQLLRCWAGSRPETPKASTNSALQLVSTLEESETMGMIKFMHVARGAWGNDVENFKMWGALNMTICMWMYRRLVLDHERGVKRYARLTDALFKKCLMGVSADTNYVDWLHGRVLNERDRAPCYTRLKAIFQKRMKQETKTDIKLPAASWTTR